MTCKEDLVEEDQGKENLYGTAGDMGKGFDPDSLDIYIDGSHTSQTNSYIIYGADLFKFLHQRYGGSIIKRFYIRKGSSYYT